MYPAARFSLTASWLNDLRPSARLCDLYRVMFGGVWTAQPDNNGSVSDADLLALGSEALEVLTASLIDCIESGASTSTAPRTDAIALWLGLHGLAHQRAVLPHFPWPEDISSRTVCLLASLDPQP